MTEPILTVYSTAYCGDCYRVKTFLDRHAVSYQWVDIDETPGAYKDIKQVMRNQSDLVKIVAELKQVVCVKG